MQTDGQTYSESLTVRNFCGKHVICGAFRLAGSLLRDLFTCDKFTINYI